MLFLIIFASIAIPVRDIVSHDDADSGLTDYLDYGDTTTTSAHDYYNYRNHLPSPNNFYYENDSPLKSYYSEVVIVAVVSFPFHLLSTILFWANFFVSRAQRTNGIEVQIEDVNIEDMDNIGLPAFNESFEGVHQTLPRNQRPPEYRKTDLFV
ncbi:hypothetical protein L596_009808 [Steinernema carpocapsae]|uniref:Uncharacterized protein n=1 Tax=Steinernema carpocapsae TaxID=34508 RepID=A0A4U5PHR5_STECR|nr:hypothetical protein L596_009808 [Steinernema carpocapsae]